MSEEITIVTREKQIALTISDVVGTMKLGKVMGPAYESIAAELTKQGVQFGEGDIPFCKYSNLDWEQLSKKGIFSFINVMFFQKWHLEMGIPCPESAEGKDNIKKSELEAGCFVRAIHTGPYMKLKDTYEKVTTFAAENNLSFKDYSVEYYLNDPREISADQLKTEVLVAISN